MAALLLLLCVVAVGVALGIVYLLYGPTPAQPLGTVPRASMTPLPQHHAPVTSYNPEAVFAAEHSSAIADASRGFATLTPAAATTMPVPVPLPVPVAVAPVTSVTATPPPLPAVPSTPARSRALPPPTPSFMRGRVTSPQPLPRARAARGTDSPRSMPTSPRSLHPASDSFVELDPTLLADETMAS